MTTQLTHDEEVEAFLNQIHQPRKADATTKLTEAITLLRGCSEAMGFDTEHGQLVLAWLSALDTRAQKSERARTSQLSRIHGLQDAAQDSFESCPFASVGGLDNRHEMTAPSYIDEQDRAAYLEGYRAAAEKMYGPDWLTCSFSWVPSVPIPGTTEEPTP